MKKIAKIATTLAVALGLSACGAAPQNGEQSTESAEQIMQITTAQGLVNYLLGYFESGREQYILDRNVEFTQTTHFDRTYMDIYGEQVLVEFAPTTDTFKSKDGSYYYEFTGYLFGSHNVPAEYYFMETQKTKQYGLQEELKRYVSFVSNEDRFQQYGVIDETVEKSKRDYYWEYENAEEYAELHKRNTFGILHMYFNNQIFAFALNGDFSDLTDENYDYTRIKEIEISQVGTRVDFSFTTEDLDGAAYGGDSDKQVFTDVVGFVDVASYELYFNTHWKVYKGDLLWNERKSEFSVTPNDEDISFVLDREYELSIDAKEW